MKAITIHGGLFGKKAFRKWLIDREFRGDLRFKEDKGLLTSDFHIEGKDHIISALESEFSDLVTKHTGRE